MANFKTNNTPCMDCEKKGCGAYHDKCEKYQQFLLAKKNREEAMKKAYDADKLENRRNFIDNYRYDWKTRGFKYKW